MPTLDEEAGIAECIRRATAAFREMGVSAEIVVADSSTDRTPEIAREMGAIVVEPDEPGYGYAYRYAFERARGDVIAMGDADTTYDFTELPKLFEHVVEGDADVAMGSRLDGEIRDGAMPPLHQHVGNPLLTRFLNAFYDAGVSDAHSGMRVFTREAWEEMECDTDGMEFASEMIMEAGARDLDIAEVPITYHEREGEATLDSFSDGWRHVKFMLLNAPGYLFSAPGIALGLVGAALIAVVALDVSVASASFGIRTLIAGSLLAITGVQVASFGVFATVASDPVRRPTDPVTGLLTDRLSLESGATLGLATAAAGGAYAAWAVLRWAATGFTALPPISTSLLAFTAVVVGLQVAFGSFLLAALGSE
ncbi:glycosyltransferase family 2 protein [Halobaculum sp. CBA1158]|uniref:glycosyltransferase family 2 protein n=1 Tax=Halobaculum sp. CBA1158 TaxID=2904243 RepID=UPI001F3A2490|nr:glycosyltransferase family 2 protein [Halobaculum sp. CBA1158]UIP01308.1 glycosyltransferase family 2 protein [Halobaculum sp. CBA1158]